jgi:WD40 repeat protein
MADETQDRQNIQADPNSVAAGDISIGGSIEGNFIIGHENRIGYTARDVSELIVQIRTTFQPKPFEGRCPYKGLDYFEEEDAGLFFGREKLVEDLIDRANGSRTLFVTGPSGSGKSSVVRAGLIHALKQGSLKDSERWLYGIMKPGREPIAELARVTAKLAKSTNAEDEICTKAASDPTIFRRWCEIVLGDNRGQRVLLFIDQFEEIFTQINKETANTFIDLLDNAISTENGRVTLLFAMRSDFVSNCAIYLKLNAMLNSQFVQIGAMSGDELVSAIAQPALRVGLSIDPELIAQIINDMQGEPGALPLMQFALKDLFDAERAKGGIISLNLNDYMQRGGIRKALERHADESFNKLDSHEQELARSIFSGLIEVGRGTQDTRRTAIFEELVPAGVDSTEVQAIVRKLADARLVTTDEMAGKDTVAISHEKLIDAWPWLRKLVDENRDVIALQNETAADAKEWDEHERDASYLYSGARLANVNEKLKANKLVLSGTALDYVQNSQARQQRNRFVFIAAITVIIVLLAMAAIVFSNQADKNSQLARRNEQIALTAQAASTQAISQQATAQAASTLAVQKVKEADEQTNLARNGELSAQSIALRDRKFQISLLLGVEAYKSLASVQSSGAVLDNVQAHPQILMYLSGHTNAVKSVAFSPDGKTLASGSSDSTVILWEATTGKRIGQPLSVSGNTSAVNSVAFSPDGKTLAAGRSDSTVILWDVASGKPIRQPLSGHTYGVFSIAFSPDGKTLASGGGDHTVILWDVATGKRIGQPLTGHTNWVNSVTFSPDGKTLASGSWDNTIILWDVETGKPIGQPLSGHTDVVASVAFSPDGKTLASGSWDNTIILWDVESDKPIGQPLTGHTHGVTSVDFSPDGKTLVSGSNDHTVILWDVATGKPVDQPFTGHTDVVAGVAFSPDGKTLASGSGDSTIIIWKVSTNKPIRQQLSGHTSTVVSVAFSPDGKTLASGHADNTIILWDIATGKPISQPLSGHSGLVTSVTFSSNGKILASGSLDSTIILWDVATSKPIGQPLRGNATGVESVACSPDGRILASGMDDKTIILWNIATGKPIGQPLTGHTDVVDSVAFSPDGKTLASGSSDHTIILWDIATGKPIGQPLSGHTGLVASVTFSPDGKTLASGSSNHTIILWDIATGKPIGQPLTGHTDVVDSVAFSPDGKTLASGGADTTIILWDVATGKPFGQPLTGHTSLVSSVEFSPDGKTLASGSWDNTIIIWDVDYQSWIDKSCQRAGRNLTRTEWAQYLPYRDYPVNQEDATCPELPLEPEATPTP